MNTDAAWRQQSLDAFLQATASSAPAPGGGGVAALTAASAAALLEMVANLTLHKAGYEDAQAVMADILMRARQLRQECLAGIAADGAAFQQVIQAVRLPKDTPRRETLVQQAFQEAARVPFRLGKKMFTLSELAVQAVKWGNKWAITDAAIAALQARAAMRASFYSVRINLQSVHDEAFVAQLVREMRTIEEQAAAREEQMERTYRDR